jgi:hypothetical protein
VTQLDNSNVRTKSEPAPARRSAAPPASTRVPVKSDPTLNEDDVAELEAHLAAERERMMAKIAAKRAAEEKARREEAARVEAAKRAAEEKARQEAARVEARKAKKSPAKPAANDVDPQELAQFKKFLAAAGVRAPVTTKVVDDEGNEVPENDYKDTERVQIEINALLDLLGVVRKRDVIEHVKQNDGSEMTPANVKYHVDKMINRGLVHKVTERYFIPGLGFRTRDAYSKDIQKLLEVLEGKKTVKS